MKFFMLMIALTFLTISSLHANPINHVEYGYQTWDNEYVNPNVPFKSLQFNSEKNILTGSYELDSYHGHRTAMSVKLTFTPTVGDDPLYNYFTVKAYVSVVDINWDKPTPLENYHTELYNFSYNISEEVDKAIQNAQLYEDSLMYSVLSDIQITLDSNLLKFLN